MTSNLFDVRLMLFLHEVLSDWGVQCRVSSTSLDLKTIEARSKTEGVSFLTITLPTFCKAFEYSLAQEAVSPSTFKGFAFKGGLPKFLSGFLSLVFDRSTGRLLPQPSVDAIAAVRQVTLLYSKLLIPCSDARVQAAFDKFVAVEQDVVTADHTLPDSYVWRFERMSRMLWVEVFTEVDRQVYYRELVPKHGPGATAEHISGNLKWAQQEWTDRLESEFPAMEYLIPSLRWSSCHDSITYLDPGAERPSRIVAVPKTLKTPRIIAIEPTCMQYTQQALLRGFEEAFQRFDTLWQLIGWRDQAPNQRLALRGSLTGDIATLDLSDASDRVSNRLVLAMLANHPHLSAAVQACRTRNAEVPGHGVQPLAKFASMGSALTFPLEAMVFTSIVFLGIEKGLNRPLTVRDVKRLVGSVRVYGDDICLPVDYAGQVVDELEAFGLKVNQHKSFWTGRFRESCGKEYYDGSDVTVVRVKSLFPTHRLRDAWKLPKPLREEQLEAIARTVTLRNRCYLHGLWRSARYLDELLERLIPFPSISSRSKVLGRLSFLPYQTDGNDPRLHRPFVRGLVISPLSPLSEVDDVGALQKVFTFSTGSEGGSERTCWNDWWDEELPLLDRNHLHRAGRPSAVNMQLKKAAPY